MMALLPAPPAPTRGILKIALLCCALAASALSAQEKKPASTSVVAPPPAATAAKPPPGKIELPSAKDERAAAKETGEEAKTAPVAGAEEAAKAGEKVTEKPAPHIALIVPLTSKALGKVADAVKAGFVAGAAADGKNAPPWRIYPADDETASLAAQYRKALNAGAATIVGGVTRDGANMMVKESSFVPALALNAPAADTDLPERFFYLSLNLDWEARLAARTASNDGLKKIAVVAANTPLAKRIQDSFEKEWLRLGGEIATRIAVASVAVGDAAEGARITAAMEKAGADSVFLAADMDGARVARPYLPQGMPVFATSMTIHPRAQAVENLDLENVRFMEMPWFVQADHSAVMAYGKPAEPLAVDYERLYALGIDAWRLAQLVAKHAKAKEIPPLDGVTGRLTLDGHQFTRTPLAVELRDGKPTLFRAATE